MGGRLRIAIAMTMAAAACSGAPQAQTAKNLVLVTIDTLRADHLRAYGYRRAQPQSSFFDFIASTGVLFEHAYAAAPITLPSHATMLTGRYPPGHGARDNGMKMSDAVPTLATELKAHGFRTAAFIAAFPLDHQFGLARGFDVYSDRMPRDAAGRQANERPASQVVDEALAWLRGLPPATSTEPPGHSARYFLWVHVFEPHAPYGDAADRRPVLDRYDEEIEVANRELMRLLEVIGQRASPETIVIVAGDHGESFGEHGEYAHSLFVYDTTLQVPLAIRGPGIRRRPAGDGHVAVSGPVTLADLAPTAMKMLGFTMKDVDGVDLTPALAGGTMPARELYAESFAPLVEFGWAPLRAIRSGEWKYIAAPTPELYDLRNDAAEQTNAAAANGDTTRRLEGRVSRYSSDTLDARAATPGSGAAERLRALGYSAGSSRDLPPGAGRADPKDRRELAGRIAQVTSGELSGAALVSALEGIVRDDPRNGQAHLRLGYARVQAGDCVRGEREFQAALAAGLASADTYLGLAGCMGQRRDLAGAGQALAEAQRLEPDNPVVTANIGILKASQGDHAAAIEALKRALAADPNLHEARFNLALAYARAGQRAEAAAAARDLLARLPAGAPQRPEVERLLQAIGR